MRRITDIKERQLQPVCKDPAVSIVPGQIADPEHPAFTDRHEETGEPFDFHLPFNPWAGWITEVNDKQRIHLLKGDDIGLFSQIPDRPDALIPGKAGDISHFTQFLIQYIEIVDIHPVPSRRGRDAQILILFIHGKLVINPPADLSGGFKPDLFSIQGSPDNPGTRFSPFLIVFCDCCIQIPSIAVDFLRGAKDSL